MRRFSLGLIREVIIQSTKSQRPNSFSRLFLNQAGLTLLAPLLVSLIVSLGTLLIYKSLKENQGIIDRTEVLLCLKQYEKSRRSYIKSMASFNLVISSAFALSFLPPVAPYAKQVQRAAKKIQQFYHLSHLKNPTTFQFCSSLISLNYLKNLPYKTRGKIRLVRRIDGTVPLVKKKWSELIWSKRKKIVFKSDYSLEGRFESSPQVVRKEFSKQALRNWKESYGQLFSL